MWKQLTKNLRRLSALLLLLATVVNTTGCVDLPKITTENTIDTGENLQKLVDSNYAHLERLSESIGGDALTTITSFMTQLEIYSLQLDKIAARRIADLDARTQAKMLEIQRYTEAVNQYAQEITHIIGDETEQLVKVTGEETRVTVDKISGEAQILIGATGQEVRLTIDKASGELQVLSGVIGEELRLTIEKIAQEAAKLLDKATQDVKEILREIEISQRRLERDVEQGLVRVINGILYGVVIAFDLGLAVGGVLSGLILTFIAAYGWGRLIFRYKLPMAGIQRAIAIGLLFVTFIASVSPFVFLSGQIRELVLISPIVNGAAPIVSSGNNLPPFIDTPEIWLFKPESIIISSTSRTLEAIGANLTAWGEPQIAYANIPLSVLGITEDKITINIEPVLLNPSFADYIGIQFHNRTANVDYRVPIVIATLTPPLTPIASPIATLEPTPEVVVNTNMNVRGGPGTAYPIIGAAAVGQKFYVKGKDSSGEWWKIDYNGQDGWLFGQLVTPERTEDVAIEQNIPTPPPPTSIPPTPIPLATICPQPVVTGFTVTSTNIKPGEETILRWNRVENVQSVAIADGDILIGVDFSGELKVSPKQPTTTYKLTVGYCDNKTMVLVRLCTFSN